MSNSLKKVTSIFLGVVLLLSGCSKTSSKASALFVPTSCATTEILNSLPKNLAGATWIDEAWQPTKGSDLETALSEGGLACHFGLGSAEVGTTILWSPDDGFVFSERTPQWTKSGQKKVDIPGIDESSAYVLTEGAEDSSDYHVWTVNLLYKGFWIQVNATFTDSLEKMVPLIKAAISSLRDQKTMDSENISGCYAVTVDGDLLTMKLDQQDRNIITADLYFGYTKKDSSEGKMFASYTNGILTGDYQVVLLNKTAKYELFFKGDKSGFVQGSGPTEQVKDELKFKRPLQITWDEKNIYKSSDKCKPLDSK